MKDILAVLGTIGFFIFLFIGILMITPAEVVDYCEDEYWAERRFGSDIKLSTNMEESRVMAGGNRMYVKDKCYFKEIEDKTGWEHMRESK